MTAGYLEKLKAEMEDMLGCKIEIVEDKDSSYPCKIEYARNYPDYTPYLNPIEP